MTPPLTIMPSEPWVAAVSIAASIRAHVGYSATSQLKRLWSVARPRVIHW